jgi:hypothetical protein
MSAKKSRLTLEFDAKALAAIERVKKRTTLTSKTAVIQRALALFDLYTEHEAAGGEVYFKTKDGKTDRLRVLS